MLLILGLFLIGIGIFLSTYATMNPRTGWPDFRPYLGIGLVTISVVAILICASLTKIALH